MPESATSAGSSPDPHAGSSTKISGGRRTDGGGAATMSSSARRTDGWHARSGTSVTLRSTTGLRSYPKAGRGSLSGCCADPARANGDNLRRRRSRRSYCGCGGTMAGPSRPTIAALGQNTLLRGPGPQSARSVGQTWPIAEFVARGGQRCADVASLRRGRASPGTALVHKEEENEISPCAANSMETRRLGRNGPVVSALGLGCMGMSQSYGRPDEAESVRTIHRALELGVTFLDTADVYGPHTNEELVGRAIRGRREDVFLATKFGLLVDVARGTRAIDGSPQHVREACEASLQRLGVDVIDLYLPAPGRPQHSDRTDGRRDGAVGEGGEGPVPRPIGSQRDHATSGASGSSDCRGPE